MTSYEIEIKSLLGDPRNAVDLVGKMKESDPNFVWRGKHKQLNHYFIIAKPETVETEFADSVPVEKPIGDLAGLKSELEPLMPPEKQKEFDHIVEHAKDYSIRTRWADGLVLFVIKASVDDTTSSNGTARQEFESPVDIKFEALDQLLLDHGFAYQAKWSRERDEYHYKGLNVTVDKNAGYGYLAEFESVIENPDEADKVKANIRKIMAELGVTELPQNRLERMFKFYNEHWQQYYGTEEVFNIE